MCPSSTPKDRAPSFLSDRMGPFVRMTDSHLPAFQKSNYGSLISGVTATRLNTVMSQEIVTGGRDPGPGSEC